MKFYQKETRKVSCPVCTNQKGHFLWKADSHQAAQHFVLKDKYSERHDDLVTCIEELWQKSTCEVVQCSHCGFCHSNPYIAGDAGFYQLAYVNTNYPKWKWEFQITYDTIEKFNNKDLHLLEIGAGDGAFIQKLIGTVLPKENIVCTEFSPYGKAEIEKLGVKCFSEDIRKIPLAEFTSHFDIVCLFQVLEHLDQLDILFQRLSDLMKAGGHLFIAVPNDKRIEFNELNGALLDMPPNHIGRWTRKSFEEIGKRFGFRLEGHSIEKSGFMAKAKQLVFYRFLQRSKMNGSLANRIFQIENKYLLRLMQLIGLVFYGIMTVPVLLKMKGNLGDAQWVHFVKN